MILDEFALPEGDEAEYLLGGLARLIELRGLSAFVSAPILLPQARFFPDRVGTRADGAATLLRRLLAYAGLEPSGIEVEVFGEEDPGLVRRSRQDRQHTAAWFVGVAEGIYRFGVRESELRDERALVGILGHEVAHAYRSHHRLVVRDREMEEKLTDLTTVYLGFGVFALETSFTFRSGHYGASGERLLYERNMRGYLLPGQLAFLLAAQLAARNLRKNELKSVAAALSPNQAEAVARAFESLSAEPLALAQGLRLPPLSEWPAPISLEDSLIQLAPTRVHVNDTAALRATSRNERKIAFRVARDSLIVGGSGGFVAGFLLGLVLDLGGMFWPFAFVLGFVGAVVGKLVESAACSSCNRSVPRGSVRCSACNAQLVGDIARLEDRFDAEERYFSEHPANDTEARAPL